MSEWISANWGVIWDVILVVAVVSLALIVRAAWRNYRIREALRLRWLVVRCRFPWFGLISRLARQRVVRTHTMQDESKWSTADFRVCSQFRLVYDNGLLPLGHYSKAENYLRKAGEAGREELGVFGSLGILLLIATEAMILAYVLAGYTVPDGSSADELVTAAVIGGLLAVVLAFLTHRIGREWHLRSLVKTAREMWANDGQQRPLRPKDKLFISIGDDSYDDEYPDHPPYHQMTRRIRGNKHFTPGIPLWTIFSIVFILFLAFTGYVIRTGQAEQASAYETGQFSASIGDSDPLTASPGTAAPGAENVAGDKKPIGFQKQVAFLLLAILFCTLQLISMWVSYRFGFSGIYSKTAARIVNCFGTLAEYEMWSRQRLVNVANAADETLAKLMEKQDAFARKVGIGKDWDADLLPRAQRTFKRYLDASSDGDGGGERVRFALAEAPAPESAQAERETG